MILLTTFFKNEPREEELVHCIKHNLDQPFFSRVFIFCERGYLPPIEHPKLEFVSVSDRPTYGAYFEFANKSLLGEFVVVSNTDIKYDSTMELLASLPPSRWDNHLFCITRVNEDGQLQNQWSQDTWVFKAPICKMQDDIILGIDGCDTYLAQKAVEAGLTVSNPCHSVRCHHYHRSGGRRARLNGSCYWSAPGYTGHAIPFSTL